MGYNFLGSLSLIQLDYLYSFLNTQISRADEEINYINSVIARYENYVIENLKDAETDLGGLSKYTSSSL
ncbi:MAG: hypothetical protein WC934_14700, partial [Acidithiobacillus sp.]|uniref:hypothetical protein n=1 Tax=Acidithiobacillus sp. TaxID=1872118 RepID=UPI00355D1B49